MTELSQQLKIIYKETCLKFWMIGLENEEYAFCWGNDFIKNYNSVKIDTSLVNGLGLGCGILRFWLDNIYYKFEYDEITGLSLETKDANEDSPEEIKQKIISFGQEIFNELVRKEDEKKLRGY